MFKLRIKNQMIFGISCLYRSFKISDPPNNTRKESISIDKTICKSLSIALDALEFHNTR